jgi:hypothetical protein
MPTIHFLKCWPVYMGRVLNGSKRFEIRNNDRDFQTGDTIILQEWDPKRELYTDQNYRPRFNIDYVLHDHEGLKAGFVIMSLTPLTDQIEP